MALILTSQTKILGLEIICLWLKQKQTTDFLAMKNAFLHQDARPKYMPTKTKFKRNSHKIHSVAI